MKRHPVDLFSLLAGLVFVLVAVVYLLAAGDMMHVRGRLVVPLVLIALGASGLVSAVLTRVRRKR